ncbi:MAG: DNA polymerase III subunit epsilon [Pseudomonadota bacterium]
MREIVMDTETTGLKPRDGDRIVEIGCVELLNHIPSGATYHCYINPERDMPADAYAVHGLSEAFLKAHPVFAGVVDDFLGFIGNDQMIIHNARFDIGFINAELERLERPTVNMSRVTDTLDLARRRHPGAQNSLDALCSRYGIDNSNRELHGALLDSELLADVYIELIGGRQSGFSFATGGGSSKSRIERRNYGVRPSPLAARLTEEDREAHRAFVKSMHDAPIWARHDPSYADD